MQESNPKLLSSLNQLAAVGEEMPSAISENASSAIIEFVTHTLSMAVPKEWTNGKSEEENESEEDSGTISDDWSQIRVGFLNEESGAKIEVELIDTL